MPIGYLILIGPLAVTSLQTRSSPAVQRASLKEKISRLCCKCRAIIVRRAGLVCTLRTLTLSVCHAWGNPKLTLHSAGLTALIARVSVLPLCARGYLSFQRATPPLAPSRFLTPRLRADEELIRVMTKAVNELGSNGLHLRRPRPGQVRGLAGHPRCVRVGNDYGKTRLYSPIRSKTTALPRCARHHAASAQWGRSSPQCRGDESSGKRSHRNRSSSPERVRLLQPQFPRPQKDGGLF